MCFSFDQQFNVTKIQNEHYVLQEIISHIREVVSSASIDTLRAVPTLLGEFSLNPDEERLFNEINESFRQVRDFLF